MWGDCMGEMIGRAVSRKTALRTLRIVINYVPKSYVDAYVAALNRVMYEFKRHDPVKPTIDGNVLRCGKCGAPIVDGFVYCPNCGREVEQ